MACNSWFVSASSSASSELVCMYLPSCISFLIRFRRSRRDDERDLLLSWPAKRRFWAMRLVSFSCCWTVLCWTGSGSASASLGTSGCSITSRRAILSCCVCRNAVPERSIGGVGEVWAHPLQIQTCTEWERRGEVCTAHPPPTSSHTTADGHDSGQPGATKPVWQPLERASIRPSSPFGRQAFHDLRHRSDVSGACKHLRVRFGTSKHPRLRLRDILGHY